VPATAVGAGTPRSRFGRAGRRRQPARRRPRARDRPRWRRRCWMRARTLGALLLLFGAVMLLRGRGPGGLFVEFLWLAALLVLAAVLWPTVRARYGLRVAIVAHAVVAVIAVTSLKFLAGPGILTFIALALWLVYRRSGSSGSRAVREWALVPFGIMTKIGRASCRERVWVGEAPGLRK